MVLAFTLVLAVGMVVDGGIKISNVSSDSVVFIRSRRTGGAWLTSDLLLACSRQDRTAVAVPSNPIGGGNVDDDFELPPIPRALLPVLPPVLPVPSVAS